MRVKLINFASWTFSLIFILVFFGKYFLNIVEFYIDFNKFYLTLLIIAFFALGFGIFFASKKILSHLDIKTKKTKVALKVLETIIVCAVFAIQLYIANLACFHTRWDCGCLIQNGYILATEEAVDSSSLFNYNYYGYYPNNILLTVLFKYIYIFCNFFCKLFTQNALLYETFYKIITFINCIVLDIVSILLFKLIKKMQGLQNAILSLIFIIPFVIFIPYMLIPYSDTFGMIIPITILYLFVNAKTKLSKVINSFLIGFLTMVGYYIKPTNIIVFIAIALVCIIYSKLNIFKTRQEYKNKKIYEKSQEELKQRNLEQNIINTYTSMISILGIIVLFTLGIMAGNLTYNLAKKDSIDKFLSTEKQEEKEFTWTHFLMMGLNVKSGIRETTAYGGYNGEDFAFTRSLKGKEEKQLNNLEVYKMRMKQYGLTGYINFLIHKINWILNDGNLFYAGEGEFYLLDPYDTSQTGQTIQKFYNIYTNEYKAYAYVNQGFWDLMLIGLMFSLTLIKKVDVTKLSIDEICEKEEIYLVKYKILNIAKLTLIGLIMFLLLFEGRSRYLINHIPMFIYVSTFGLSQVYNTMMRKKNKKKQLTN